MILSASNFRKAKNYLKKNGIKDTIYASAERVLEKRRNKYDYQPPSPEELERQRAYKWKYAPKISIVVPAYETKPVFMEDLILSVTDQTYENYELIIADASESRLVEKVVKELAKEYEHIVYHRLSENKGISGNTNQGIELATGDYIGLLDHDDLLTPDALFEVVSTLEKAYTNHIEPALVYTDEDKTNTYLEVFYEPNRKPEINRDLLCTNNYVCHFSVYRSDVLKELKLRAEFDGAQDYDLVLRCMKWTEDKYGENWSNYICHVPKIVYHWRCHAASTAENTESKAYAYEAGKRAVEDYLKEIGIRACVSHMKHLGFYRVDYETSVFESRPEIGVIGGPVYGKKGAFGRTILSGALNEEGEAIYKGIPEHFSGELHRAVLQQQVYGVDIRNIEIREDLKELFRETTGISYDGREAVLDKIGGKEKEEIFRKKSLEFCNKVNQLGICVLYDPKKGEGSR